MRISAFGKTVMVLAVMIAGLVAAPGAKAADADALKEALKGVSCPKPKLVCRTVYGKGGIPGQPSYAPTPALCASDEVVTGGGYFAPEIDRANGNADYVPAPNITGPFAASPAQINSMPGLYSQRAERTAQGVISGSAINGWYAAINNAPISNTSSNIVFTSFALCCKITLE